jgi:hypothetical protein
VKNGKKVRGEKIAKVLERILIVKSGFEALR